MGSRSHTTLKKRQKELARLEKQRKKAARRMERKQAKHPPDAEGAASQDAVRVPPGPEVLPGLQGDDVPRPS